HDASVESAPACKHQHGRGSAMPVMNTSELRLDAGRLDASVRREVQDLCRTEDDRSRCLSEKKAILPKAFTVAVGPRCDGRTGPRTVAAATYYVTCGKEDCPQSDLYSQGPLSSVVTLPSGWFTRPLDCVNWRSPEPSVRMMKTWSWSGLGFVPDRLQLESKRMALLFPSWVTEFMTQPGAGPACPGCS